MLARLGRGCLNEGMSASDALPTVTVTQYRIDPYASYASVLAKDAQRGHGLVMSALPQGLGARPREAARCLWLWDDSRRELVVQTSVALEVAALGRLRSSHIVTAPRVGALTKFTVPLACQKTPPAAVPLELRSHLKASGPSYRSRLVTVPEDERPAWFARRMQRHGLHVDLTSLRLSGLSVVELGARGGRFPAVTFEGEGIVADPAAFSAALVSGVGKGKNFGLGLVRIDPNQ